MYSTIPLEWARGARVARARGPGAGLVCVVHRRHLRQRHLGFGTPLLCFMRETIGISLYVTTDHEHKEALGPND